ncbi:MAG: proline dehydrogenase family protein [Candidatus Krumholzibacteriia bacterium]|nr:proline dehydrogenase family protein [bacterium]MCB9513220.1 proline dehydrogenase family protein [Candidatus Latescibacterota bacterium]MCB9514684.1 proline dehydrogenase family protein [Candidatus Latescibacterota bacterium]
MPTLFDRAIAGVLPAVPRPVVRKVSSRYIAGESFDDVVRIARELRGAGLRCTMDILGENTHSPEQARQAAADYLALVDRQAEVDVDRNVSIKLSQLGLALDRQLCLDGMRGIVARSAALGGKVRIDMEDSSLTDDTLWVYRSLREEFANVGVVLQAYLHRTLADVAALASLSPAPDYRLCKGIYVEPPEVAIQDHAGINRNFLAALGAMFDGGSYVGIATHDEALVEGAKAMIAERGLGPDRYEFQMLLGVQERLRDRIVAEGHPLRVYLPYGREWYAYCMRRLKENPSVAGHVFRAMFGQG